MRPAFEVIVPTPIGDMSRRWAFGLVRQHLRSSRFVYRYSTVQTASATPARAIAQARNAGAARSGAAVLVFNDADSLVRPSQIRQAARLAWETPGLVFAFDNYCRLGKTTTEQLRTPAEAFEAPVAWEMYWSLSSGCVAIRRDCFQTVLGYSLDYDRGFEDADFAQRCAKRWPLRRVAGDLVHLWHERPTIEPEEYEPDARRYYSRHFSTTRVPA